MKSFDVKIEFDGRAHRFRRLRARRFSSAILTSIREIMKKRRGSELTYPQEMKVTVKDVGEVE